MRFAGRQTGIGWNYCRSTLTSGNGLPLPNEPFSDIRFQHEAFIRVTKLSDEVKDQDQIVLRYREVAQSAPSWH